ncbi:GIN domain-containing protein [Flagellimonas sp.]|uniref:GIN domain-containing protein n=1 Tax=Flagellimonas sp. TaxID=2058762 RepID=UPI003F4A6F89
MKKIIGMGLLLVPMLLLSQRKPKIKGSRVVTEVNEELPAFNAIQLNDDLDIVLKKSFGPGYEIIADDNLIDILKFKVEDSTLVISSFYTVSSKKQFDITINYTDLKAITAKEGSIVSKEMITSNELFVDGFANTRLTLQASAAVMDINLEDTSKSEFNVDVDSLNVTMNKRAEAYIYAVTDASMVNLEENASFTFEGTADRMRLDVIGNAKFKGERMEAGSVKTNLGDAANVRVNSYRDLELSSKGNAKTQLYGNPKITILEFMDTSQLIKKTE